jgi:protein gp37
MAKTTIEWATDVWNPVTGCTKVSEGCRNCYAEETHSRRHKAYLEGKAMPRQYAKLFSEIQLLEERLSEPLHWRKPRRVFVNSMSDLFHEDVPFDFIDHVFAVMAMTSHITYMILTKRPNRMLEYFAPIGGATRYNWVVSAVGHQLNACRIKGFGWPLPNVWLGVTAENQQAADERIPLLLQTPAAVRFVSVEPMLGPVDFTNIAMPDVHQPPHVVFPSLNGFHVNTLRDDEEHMYQIDNHLDWVICGGESGPNARPMHPDWARSLRDQCKKVGVPFFFKQWGEWYPDRKGIYEQSDSAIFGNTVVHRIGKKAAGRLLDGVEHNEFPLIQKINKALES